MWREDQVREIGSVFNGVRAQDKYFPILVDDCLQIIAPNLNSVYV